MKLTKRIALGLLALTLSGAALAQTVMFPSLTGTQEISKDMIDHIGMLRIGRVDGLVATASGTLANSTVLGKGMNVVATVASTNDSFTLPTLTGSVQITVVNGGANTLRVWPNVSTGQIDTGGAGTSKTLAANKMMILTQGAQGLWYSVTTP
jgi:hypothetical protein